MLTAVFGPGAQLFPFLVRIAVGAVFLIAGIAKIGHPADLAASITAFKLGLPPPLVAIAAVALPPLEILLGIYLVAGLLLPFASIASTLLLALFTAVIASVVLRGLSASCGCFGPGDNEPASWVTVLRDLGLLALSLYLAWWSRARGPRLTL